MLLEMDAHEQLQLFEGICHQLGIIMCTLGEEDIDRSNHYRILKMTEYLVGRTWLPTRQIEVASSMTLMCRPGDTIWLPTT